MVGIGLGNRHRPKGTICCATARTMSLLVEISIWKDTPGWMRRIRRKTSSEATPKLRAKAIRSPASAQLPQHSRRHQIPVAPAAPAVPHTPRFRALALFGRRLSEPGQNLGIPASENLHITESGAPLEHGGHRRLQHL